MAPDLARLTEEERRLAALHAVGRPTHPLFCRDQAGCCSVALLLIRLAHARAVVDAAREEHNESDCLGKRSAGLRPHPCKVCDMLAAHDGIGAIGA